MIIEDDAVSSKLLRMMLEREGHTVLVSDKIDQAWEYLWDSVLIDLIFLDNRLQGETGLDFLRDLRADPIFRAVPVVVISSHSQRSAVLEYIKLGVQHFLVKPFNALKIMGEVERAMSEDPYERFFEDSFSVCERMDLSYDDYKQELWEIGEAIRNAEIKVKECLMTGEQDDMLDSILGLKSAGLNLGFRLLVEICEHLERAALSGAKDDIELYLPHLPLLATLAEFKNQFGVRASMMG